ncbi:MAG: hypothetical protein EXR97_04950 [Nitrospiraceae bacterium]|nr:hypothetical protein [Nitrospiraceae bacterium]MSR23884.1 hypothetical protein [Nitrospiraceae bacterium]
MFQLLRMFFVTAVVGLATFPLGAWADETLKDDGSLIQINAPKEGESVGQTFDLKHDLHAGSAAHHAHVYLDGQYQKGFKGTFTNVAPGKHEIKVQAASKDHKLLPASAVVHVEVK